MDNLRRLRKDLKKTQAQMAVWLGISQQAYAAYENDVAQPPLDVVNKLADYFGTTADYLMGRGAPALPPYSNIYPLTPFGKLPVFGEIHAGAPIKTEQSPTDDWGFADREYCDGNHFFLKVTSDSMTPTIPVDALVIIRKQDTAEKNDIVAFCLNGDEATLKRYFPQPDGAVLLRGDNPESESYIITQKMFEMGEAHIMGVAREVKLKLYKK